jgi:hypothetical protein
MVVETYVDPTLTSHLRQEITPMLPRLDNYSDIQIDPKVLLLRNPSMPPSTYDAWRNDHRFGRLTCPSSRHPQWESGGFIDNVACGGKNDDDGLQCASAMIISYKTAKDRVSFHRDPVAYERIASLTLEGEGVLLLKRGHKTSEHKLQPGKAVVLDCDDCHTAKHSVVSSHRLGLVLRYVRRLA